MKNNNIRLGFIILVSVILLVAIVTVCIMCFKCNEQFQSKKKSTAQILYDRLLCNKVGDKIGICDPKQEHCLMTFIQLFDKKDENLFKLNTDKFKQVCSNKCNSVKFHMTNMERRFYCYPFETEYFYATMWKENNKKFWIRLDGWVITDMGLKKVLFFEIDEHVPYQFTEFASGKRYSAAYITIAKINE